jgi:ribosome-associated protein
MSKSPEKIEFSLKGAPFIELNKLLKSLNLVETGGQAKLLILDGLVEHNGGIENRIRAKIVAGAEINVDGQVAIAVTE